MQNNGWPFPDRPGVPLEPERDGPHLFINTAGRLVAANWLTGPPDRQGNWSGLVGNSLTWGTPKDMAELGMTYLGPCLTPAEVAEQVADTKREAWNDGYAQGVAAAHAANGDKWAVNALKYSSPAEVAAAVEKAQAEEREACAAWHDGQAAYCASRAKEREDEGHSSAAQLLKITQANHENSAAAIRARGQAS